MYIYRFDVGGVSLLKVYAHIKRLQLIKADKLPTQVGLVNFKAIQRGKGDTENYI